MHHPPLITGRIFFFFFLMTMTLTLGNECRLGENDRKLPVSVKDVGYLETGVRRQEQGRWRKQSQKRLQILSAFSLSGPLLRILSCDPGIMGWCSCLIAHFGASVSRFYSEETVSPCILLIFRQPKKMENIDRGVSSLESCFQFNLMAAPRV